MVHTFWIHKHFLIKKKVLNPHPRICLLILERKRGREREKEKRPCEKHWLVAAYTPQTGDQTRNLGMCPDQGLNPQPFGVQDDAPTNRVTLFCGGFSHYFFSHFFVCVSVWIMSVDVIFKVTESFLSYVQATDEPMKGILHLWNHILFSAISIWLILIVILSLLKFPVWLSIMVILWVCLTGPRNAQVKRCFRVCLWGCLWERLALAPVGRLNIVVPPCLVEYGGPTLSGWIR